MDIQRKKIKWEIPKKIQVKVLSLEKDKKKLTKIGFKETSFLVFKKPKKVLSSLKKLGNLHHYFSVDKNCDN